MSSNINPVNVLAVAQSTGPKPRTGSFFEAMARAWGEALDKQAATIEAQSNAVNSSGDDKPSALIELSAQSMKMQFFSSSAQTSNSAVGESLQTLARKG
jgi:hypothetical protein